jgi:hypothetical protein
MPPIGRTNPRSDMAHKLLLTIVLPLAITLAVELSLAKAVGLNTRRDRVAVALVNLVTNPILNYVLVACAGLIGAASLFSLPLFLLFLDLEVVVVFVEWGLLTWATGRPSGVLLRASIRLNLASLFAGLLVTALRN